MGKEAAPRALGTGLGVEGCLQGLGHRYQPLRL